MLPKKIRIYRKDERNIQVKTSSENEENDLIKAHERYKSQGIRNAVETFENRRIPCFFMLGQW